MPRTAGDETREQIKVVALELFTEQGFSGTSLREIAERMDFTKAALYYHYRHKGELLAELLEPVMEDSQRLIEGTSPPGQDHAAVIDLLHRYLVEVLLEHRDLIPLLFRDPGVLCQPEIGDRIEELGGGLRALLLVDDSDGAAIRAAAAIGALHTPITMPVVEGPEFIDTLVAAVAAALESRPA